MTDDEPSSAARSFGSIVVETVTVIVGTLLLVVAGGFAVAFSFGELRWGAIALPDPVRLLGWRLPVWLILVVVVEVVARRTSSRERAGLLVLAAVIASLGTTIVELVLAARVGQLPLTLFVSGLPTFEFIACAAIAGFTVTAVVSSSLAVSRRVVSIVLALVLVLGGALIIALVLEWLEVYFTLGTTAPDPTPGQETRYVLTASIGLGALLVAPIVGFVSGRRALGVIGLILLLIGLLTAGLLRVPEDLGTTPAPTYTTNPDYVPCYSGSGDCPGG